MLPIHLKMAGSDKLTCRISRRKPGMVKWLFKGDPGSREQLQSPGASKHGPTGQGWRNKGSAAQGGRGMGRP